MSNLYSVDSGTDKAYKHSGFSSSITSSFTLPDTTVTDCGWGGDNNIYIVGSGLDKLYKHSGFTSTVSSSFASLDKSPGGVSWHNSDDNLYQGDNSADKYLRNTGFTSTISSSITAPDGNSRGCGWDSGGSNLYTCGTTGDKHYKHSGFTTTITSSYSAVDINVRGTSYVLADDYHYTSDGGLDKIYRRSGFSTTINSSFNAPGTSTDGVDWETRDLSAEVLFDGSTNASFNGSSSIEIHKPFNGTTDATFDGSASLKIHKVFDGASNVTFDGVIELHGGIVSFVGSTNATFDGTAQILGELKAFDGSADTTFDGTAEIQGELRTFDGLANTNFDGAITSFISQKLFESETAAGQFSGSVSMNVGDFSFKWSIDNLEARTDYGFPTVYVDLDKDALPTGAFPEGDFYERRLLQMPRLQEVELDTRFGISGFQRVTFTIDNSDRLISGLDLQDSFVRMFFVDEDGSIYKEFKGRVVDWTLSHQVTINVEDIDALAFTQDLPKRTLNDLVESEKAADAGFAVSVIADDLGNSIPIIFGRAVKVPLLYVKADETNREYDYIVGEGAGLNSKYFQEVFTVYREDSALDTIEGNVSSSTNNTLVLESADKRPDSWYRYWWVEITSGTGAGQIIDVTAYDSNNNRITVSSNWTTNPDSSSDYRLREWRFYDGSQSVPYSGYAFVRFKKRMGENGRTDPLFADVNGLEDEINVVRAIESLLTNNDWGFGLSADTTTFNAAAALSAITSMKCEGSVVSTTSANDLLRELLGFRDITLSKADSIEIAVDQTKTSSINLGLGDETGFNNILTNSPVIEHLHPDEKVKNLKVKYRKNNQENDVYLHEIERSSSTNGVDQTINLPFVYDHDTADMVLDYKRKRLAASVKRMSLEVGQDAVNANRSDLATVDIPSLGVSSNWEITGTNVTPAGSQNLSLVPYSALPYTYVSFVSEGGTLPVDTGFDIPPDFSNTPPDPVSGLSVTGSARLSEQSDRSGVLDISWTAPNDGNYTGGEIFIRESSGGTYKSYGIHFDGALIEGLKANTNYDVQVVSIGEVATNRGLPAEDLSNLTGSSTTAPNTPSAPTGTVSGRVVTFRATPPSSTYPIKNFDWIVNYSFGGTDYTVNEHGTTLSVTVAGTSDFEVRAQVRARNVYGQTGPYSGLSLPIDREFYGQGHMGSDSIGNPQLQNNSVGNAQLQNLSVGRAEIQNAAIDTAQIETAAIQTAKIENAQITNLKIGNDQVDFFKRQNVDFANATLGPITVEDNFTRRTSGTFTHATGAGPLVITVKWTDNFSSLSAGGTPGDQKLMGVAHVTSQSLNNFGWGMEIQSSASSVNYNGAQLNATFYYW